MTRRSDAMRRDSGGSHISARAGNLARVVGPKGLSIDTPSGDRWDLALGLLASGESGILIGCLGVSRDPGGPTATGRIRVDIAATNDPASTTLAGAMAGIRRGLDEFERLREDQRFAALVADHGVTFEYVHDYGMGTVRLATVNRDGSVAWDATFRPSA